MKMAGGRWTSCRAASREASCARPPFRSLSRLSGLNIGSLDLAKVEFFKGLLDVIEGFLFVIHVARMKKVFRSSSSGKIYSVGPNR
jgi:hypothetical protein